MNLRAAIEQLDKFCQERGWKGRELKTGINYRIGGKTAVSIYSSGTDKPGTIEVAFEVDTISKITNASPSTVNAWIRKLQENIGSYARPKTQYQYPRVALASNQQLQEFCADAIKFFENSSTTKGQESSNRDHSAADEPITDERVLASILSRRGQEQFREALLDAYSNACAVTGCDTVAVLEAAHIVPHSERPSYAVHSGILLRTDIHTLFDLFLLSVNPEHGTVVVSQECKPAYQTLEGVVINVPKNAAEQPQAGLLMEHFRKWKRRNQS